MARRYDSRTTTFSPEGRLYQVEYALEAINNAAITIGILAKDGVLLAADKQYSSTLIEQNGKHEKIFKVDKHAIAAVAGLSSDASILINEARITAQKYMYTFSEPQPIEQLIVNICDIKQSYTQFGGLRPFGVSFLFAGWDSNYGFQLYHSDPSGNYCGWKATAIGLNSSAAVSTLQKEWEADLTVEKAAALACKVLLASIDAATPSASRLEFAYIRFNGTKPLCRQQGKMSPYVSQPAEYRDDVVVTADWLTNDQVTKLIDAELERKKLEQAERNISD